MAGDVEIRIQDDDGHEIHGTYRAYGGVGAMIVVTLSANGMSVRRNIESEPVEQYAEHLLRQLERKRLGKS